MEKASYRQVTRFHRDDVRSACIEHGWFARGDGESYGRMLDYVGGFGNLEGELYGQVLEETARRIKGHSDTDYGVPDIMTVLAGKCRRWFVEE